MSESTLGKNATCSSQIWWVCFVEDCFRQIQGNEKSEMKEHKIKLKNELNDLMLMI